MPSDRQLATPLFIDTMFLTSYNLASSPTDHMILRTSIVGYRWPNRAESVHASRGARQHNEYLGQAQQDEGSQGLYSVGMIDGRPFISIAATGCVEAIASIDHTPGTVLTTE